MMTPPSITMEKTRLVMPKRGHTLSNGQPNNSARTCTKRQTRPVAERDRKTRTKHNRAVGM